MARARAAQQNARRAGICGHVDKEAFFFLKCLVFVPLYVINSLFSRIQIQMINLAHIPLRWNRNTRTEISKRLVLSSFLRRV